MMINELVSRYEQLNACKQDIEIAANLIIDCYKMDGKVLICGNGGSAADSEHIVGELMKGFLKKRPLTVEQRLAMINNCDMLDDELLSKLQGGLPAVALPSAAGLNSAFCNDVDPELIYAQSVVGLGNPCDVLIALSTSGNSKNVVAAAKVAKGLGLTVIALTGESGGSLKSVADVCIKVPETETYKIQELHLPVYHYLCAATESEFFDE